MKQNKNFTNVELGRMLIEQCENFLYLALDDVRKEITLKEIKLICAKFRENEKAADEKREEKRLAKLREQDLAGYKR